MDKVTELVIIAAAGICGYVLAGRYFRKRPAGGGLERTAPPPAPAVTAEEMDEMNREAKTKRQACLAFRV